MIRERKDYVTEVIALRGLANALLKSSWTEQKTAGRLCWFRNQVKQSYRFGLPVAVLKAIEARNITLYGDPLGPDAESQRARYASWEEVIDAACRPNMGLN